MVVSIGERYWQRAQSSGGLTKRSVSDFSRAPTARFVELGSVAALVDGDVDDPVLCCRNVIDRWHAFPGLAGPARLDPVERHLAVINNRVAHGVGASMRQMHVVVIAAEVSVPPMIVATESG